MASFLGLLLERFCVKNNVKNITLLLLFIVLGVFFPPLSVGSGPTEVNMVKIGVLLPLTGPLSEIAETHRKGHEFAAREINNTGGIHALGGAKIKILYGDTKGDPSVGAKEALRLIRQEKTVALVGAYQSTVAFAASEVAEQNRIPFLVSTALADNLTQRGFQYTFRIEANLTRFVNDQFQFLKDNTTLLNPESNSIVLLYERTLWGQAAATIQRKYAEIGGYKIVAEIPYLHTLNDLNFVAETIERTKPGIILQSSYLGDSIKIAQVLQKNKWRPKTIIATGAGPKDPKYIKILGNLAEYWFVINEWSSDMKREGSNNLNKKFQSYFNHDLDGISAVSYATTWIIKEGLENAMTLNPDQLKNSLANLKISYGPATILPIGRVAFDSSGNNMAANLVTQIIAGKHRTVWPAELASTKPVFGKYFTGAQ